MPIVLSPPLTQEEYDRAADEYQRSLPLEHYMESTQQSAQREITSASFAILHAHRPEIRCFGELLILYRVDEEIRGVVPDNLVFKEPLPDVPRSSYNLERDLVQPFMTLEYVSRTNPRKDYVDSFAKYERDLQVPYYIVFRPDRLDLRVYRHDGTQYVQLEPGEHRRVAIPEIELELGLYENWLRFWHGGELLEVPQELQARIDRLSEQLSTALRQLSAKEQQLSDTAQQLSETAQQLSNTEQQLSEAQRDALDHQRRWIERAARRASRTDILEQLHAVSDSARLQAWLAELDEFL